MSDQFQFNEDPYNNSLLNKGSISGWLIKKGYAKDKSTANIILISTAIIFFTISLFLIYSSDSSVQNEVNAKPKVIVPANAKAPTNLDDSVEVIYE